MRWSDPIMIAMLTMAVGCSDAPDPVPAPAREVVLQLANTDSIVDLTSVTLITNDLAADSVDAFLIMQVKRAWSLAMHTRKTEEFNRILALGFVFRAEGEFFDLAGSIRDRLSGRHKVGYVRYENLVL